MFWSRLNSYTVSYCHSLSDQCHDASVLVKRYAGGLPVVAFPFSSFHSLSVQYVVHTHVAKCISFVLSLPHACSSGEIVFSRDTLY